MLVDIARREEKKNDLSSFRIFAMGKGLLCP